MCGGKMRARGCLCVFSEEGGDVLDVGGFGARCALHVNIKTCERSLFGSVGCEGREEERGEAKEGTSDTGVRRGSTKPHTTTFYIIIRV